MLLGGLMVPTSEKFFSLTEFTSTLVTPSGVRCSKGVGRDERLWADHAHGDAGVL